MNPLKELAVGAEAIISLKREQLSDEVRESIIKERVPKAYRHPILDEELRRQRTRKEAKILQQLPIPGPKLFGTDRVAKIEMEFINGSSLKRVLDREPSWARTVGEQLAKLHEKNIIHGDLTTSNMIVKERELFFIDFGLSFTSTDVEHKAVDIHLFKQALESKHHEIFEEAYKEFLRGYKASPHAPEVLSRLKVVERRGRNKAKV